MVFKPALINGRSLDQATATPLDYGWKTKPQSSPDDWAILKLDKPLGDKYGYMGWRTLNFADQRVKQLTKDQIRLVGYAEDFPKQNPGETAGVHAGCNIAGIYEQGVAHDCDMNPGASGGALFAKFDDGNYYVVGLNSAYMTLSLRNNPRSQQRFNFGVQVSRWATQATALRQQGAASAGK
uniref:Serine protease n=1 Tax=Oscillatoriales cyanobacterium SpSt-402 TaxID=2282168 RepID=A0A832M239_9CYAN